VELGQQFELTWAHLNVSFTWNASVLSIHPAFHRRRSCASRCVGIRWGRYRFGEEAHTNAAISIFLEDILSQVLRFSTVEGPALVRDGNKIVLQSSFLPEVARLVDSLKVVTSPANKHELPMGYESQQVRISLVGLKDELQELLHLFRSTRISSR
jgi:hypothetical protein